MQDEQPTAEQPGAHPAALDAGAEGVAAVKPAKARKPRAPRKRKPKGVTAEAASGPEAGAVPGPVDQAAPPLPPVTAPVIQQAREAAPAPAEGSGPALTAHDRG